VAVIWKKAGIALPQKLARAPAGRLIDKIIHPSTDMAATDMALYGQVFLFPNCVITLYLVENAQGRRMACLCFAQSGCAKVGRGKSKKRNFTIERWRKRLKIRFASEILQFLHEKFI
jgi:hypothetical protein